METMLQPKMTALQARLSKKIVNSMENNFASLKDRTQRFQKHVARNKPSILQTLSSYQSYATSEDEFSRIFECLDSIGELREYLTRRTGTAAVFFPLNMPIYALILYAITPSFVADAVYVRAPQRMMDLMRMLESLLELNTFFPNIKIIYASREVFVQEHVVSADVIIFTGKLSNAQSVMRKCKKDSLFLFNGWGCNPIVVGQGADLDVAAKKTVQARLFSSGQDCAGPDTILVPRNDADCFVQKLKIELKHVPVGSYGDPDTIVGALNDEAQIRLISNMFLKLADQIVHGGRIDYDTKIVHPTLIVGELSKSMNFEELFAPVIYVSVYDDDAQLSCYFEHPAYIANEMYVSLFGSCPYVESLQKSIIVKDNVIFDIDRGNDEFGGYSVGASFVASNRRTVPKPILVPREIHDYLQPGSSGYKLSPSLQAKIGKQVRSCMLDTFSSNLVFGFVFGSVARQQATGSSDINTMVILAERNEDQVNEYTTWLRYLHERHQLKFKENVSTVTLTMSELEHLCGQLNGKKASETLEKYSIFTEALAGAQCGVGGDKKLSVEYGRRLMPYSSTAQKRNPISSADFGRKQTTIEEVVSPSPIERRTPQRSIDVSEMDNVSPPTLSGCLKEADAAQPKNENTSRSRSGSFKWIRALCRRWTNARNSAKLLKATKCKSS